MVAREILVIPRQDKILVNSLNFIFYILLFFIQYPLAILFHMKQTQEIAPHIKTGQIGEELVSEHYKRHGYTVLARNYRQKWGEIDVIAEKDQRAYFIEVKTVSYETKTALEWAISHETWRPEENVTRQKLIKLSRVINTWIRENKCDKPWQIDVASVRIVPCETFSTINILKNVILD